jgi:hypothetical protein
MRVKNTHFSKATRIERNENPGYMPYLGQETWLTMEQKSSAVRSAS